MKSAPRRSCSGTGNERRRHHSPIAARARVMGPRSLDVRTRALNRRAGRALRFARRLSELLAVDGATFPATLPLLDSHARDSLDAKLGTVDSIGVVGGKLTGRARLSRHNPRSQRIAAELTRRPDLRRLDRLPRPKWAERQGANKQREKVAVAFEHHRSGSRHHPRRLQRRNPSHDC